MSTIVRGTDSVSVTQEEKFRKQLSIACLQSQFVRILQTYKEVSVL